jgi:hypothetical protein
MQAYRTDAPSSGTSLGDLLKEQLSERDDR